MTYNLVDEGWIPCTGADGSRTSFGLRETLAHASEITEVADPSPLVTVALHRLLLAILHRNFGPRDAREWGKLWKGGSFDMAVLDDYFARWHGRFDLFDKQHPFYQVASLEQEYAGPAAKLAQELASGNNATLFDHTTEASPITWTPSQAARYLVAHHAFAVGGLVSLRKGEDPNVFKSAYAAPLNKAAVAVVRGDNLFQTLMLNLLPYSREDELPYPMDPNDLPAWERDDETRAESRRPNGYLDLLTWQSRRIRLYKDQKDGGGMVVRQVAIMKGFQLPRSGDRYQWETMVAFRANKQKGAEDPWLALEFREERAVWRDSMALFQSVAAQQYRPRTLDWLGQVVDAGFIERSQKLPLDLYGLSADRAKVLFWRNERLPLRLAYLDDQDLLDTLRRSLEHAEQVARALGTALNQLATRCLAAQEGRTPDSNAVRKLVASLGAERIYWSRLDLPFKQLLEALPRDVQEDEDGERVYGEREMPLWRSLLTRAAKGSFEQAARSLGTSARVIKATAIGERALNAELKRTSNGPAVNDQDTGREPHARQGGERGRT